MDTIVALMHAQTADLRELALIAKADPRIFYRGARLDGVDLSGQDIRDMEFTELESAQVLVDENTKFDPIYKRDFNRLIKSETDNIAIFLSTLDRLDLEEKTVVGDYRRYDDKVLAELRRRVGQISHGLKNKTHVLENFLIWAAPGSGKTYFVEEIHKSLGKDISYFEINFAATSEADARAKIAAIEATDQPTLTLYDEIDAKKDEAWPYDAAFPILTLNMRPDRPQRRAVFVLIGSTPPGLGEMVEGMKKRIKGHDLLDRVTVQFAIPPLAMGDFVILVASQAGIEARKRSMKIETIDKMALYYVLKSGNFNTPRQIAQLFARAIPRVPNEDTNVTYGDLFGRNDPEAMDFWTKNTGAVELLRDTAVHLDGLNE